MRGRRWPRGAERHDLVELGERRATAVRIGSDDRRGIARRRRPTRALEGVDSTPSRRRRRGRASTSSALDAVAADLVELVDRHERVAVQRRRHARRRQQPVSSPR